MDRIVERLTAARTLLLATHESPDGDALGALLALGMALEALGKSVTFFNESAIPAVYRFLPCADRVTDTPGAMGDLDAAVVLDCGDIARVGRISASLESLPLVVNIDHHVTNTGFGHLRYVDPDASSSAEVVYRLIGRLGVRIDSRMATAIYTGILTDTGSFRFANTNSRAFSICAEMVDRGVNPYTVAQHVFGTYSLGRIKLLNMALDSIELSRNGKLSMMTLTREMFQQTGTLPEDVDGIINYAKRIRDVKVAVMIVESPNGAGSRPEPDRRRFHVSMRSDGSVDVAAIAASFGGGGHSNAAGFGIDAPLADVKGNIYHLAEAL